MGKRGPLPKPVTRRRNKRAASGTIAARRPPMPRTLSAEAKKEWRRVVPELDAMGWLAGIDRAVLIRYCTVWADWVEMDEMLQEVGKLVRGANGAAMRNPLWGMRRDAERTLGELALQLGLTPVTRLRNDITHEPPSVADDDDDAPTPLDDYRKRMGA